MEVEKEETYWESHYRSFEFLAGLIEAIKIVMVLEGFTNESSCTT